MDSPPSPSARSPGADADLGAAPSAAEVDALEAAAFADLYAGAPPALRERFGLQVQRRDGLVALLAPGLPHTLFNRAIGLGLGRPANADDVEWLRELYAASGISAWWLHLHPAAGPADLHATLQAHGFVPARRATWRKFWRPAAPAPRVLSDLVAGVVDTGDAGLAASVAAAIAAGFELPSEFAVWFGALHGRPGWRLYALRDGSSVVGGGCVFVHRDGAWLGMGAVDPRQRRRGGQRALLARRIDDAQAGGARWTSTETGEPVGDEPNPSLSNIQWSGFRSLGSRLNLVAPPPSGA